MRQSLREGALQRDEARFLQAVGGVEAEELIDVADGLDHDGDDLVANPVDPADVDVADDVLVAVKADAALRRLDVGLA